MCCHKHPDNGSDLAVADAEDADIRAQLCNLRQERDEAEAQVAEVVSRVVDLQAERDAALVRLVELGSQ